MSVNSGFFMPPVSHLRNHLATPAEITLTHYRICMVVAARGEPPTEETFPHSTNLAAAKSPSLTMSAMSSTICAHHCVHSLKSAISLWWVVCAFQPGLASNRWGQNSVRPNHLFDPDSDHDYFFELPSVRGAGYPIITSVIYCTPWRFPGAPACEPNFSN